MKRVLVGVVVCFCLGGAQAQVKPGENYVLTWNKGNVLFKSGDTLQCDIRYNHAASPHGVLQISKDDAIITLYPQDVSAFSFYDDKKQRYRRFSSLPAGNGDSSQAVFMENLYSDTRFSIVNHRTMDVPYHYMNYTRLISKPVRMSKKYILETSTGRLIPLSRQNAIRLMDGKQSEVKDYIQSRRLKFRKTADYINLFEYHNTL